MFLDLINTPSHDRRSEPHQVVSDCVAEKKRGAAHLSSALSRSSTVLFFIYLSIYIYFFLVKAVQDP